MIKKSFVSVIAILGMGAVLAGCGSSTPTASKSPNDLWAKVQSTHVIKMAQTSYPPEDFQDPNTQQWTGFDVDVLNGFAKSIGAKMQFTSLPLAAAIQAVQNHSQDITIDIYWTAQRAQVISYSRPMFDWVDVVGVNSTKPTISAPTVAAMTGKTLGVVIGSEEVQEAQKVPQSTVKQFNTLDEALSALSSGRIDGLIVPDTDIPQSKALNPSLNITTLGSVPSSISPPLASIRGYFGVPKGSYSTRFLQHLNSYIKTIECNGTEQQMLAKYGMKSNVYLQGLCSAPNVYKGF